MTKRSFKIKTVESKCQAFTVTTQPIGWLCEIIGMCLEITFGNWQVLVAGLYGNAAHDGLVLGQYF